jgi:hypothetical protein
MTQKNELAKVQNYLALTGDTSTIMEALEANLGGGGLSPFDLDRVKVPSQGSISWEIPDLDEESISAKVLTGIIIHNAPVRSFWTKGLDEGGPTPPDCYSNDLINGVGTPGGDCLTCPMNQWGSDTKGGTGKACSERRLLFMLRPQSFLPIVVQVPPSSLRNLNQYMLRLAGSGTAYYHVETSLSLEKATQSGGGLPYSKVAVKLERRLTAEESATVDGLSAKLRPLFVTAARTLAQDSEFLND